MTALVLPVAARAALAATSPSAELVARGAGPLHLYAGTLPGLRDFTLSGALRRPHRPVCGQDARRWYLAGPDGRRLCGRCADWARRRLELTTSPVTVVELVDVLDRATSPAEVDAVQAIVLTRGLTSTRVTSTDPLLRDAPLHRVIARARSRVTPARVGVVERNWLQRSPARRVPRRIA
jgi:hypothetical protein